MKLFPHAIQVQVMKVKIVSELHSEVPQRESVENPRISKAGGLGPGGVECRQQGLMSVRLPHELGAHLHQVRLGVFLGQKYDLARGARAEEACLLPVAGGNENPLVHCRGGTGQFLPSVRPYNLQYRHS